MVDILEKGKSLFNEAGLPFTYTSKKSFIEMFCSKKAIRLSKQPFYESGRKNGDVSVILPIETKPSPSESSVVDQCLNDQSFTNNDHSIPPSVERELKGDIVKWFQLESKYRFISIYDVIVKALEWARLLGAVTGNDKEWVVFFLGFKKIIKNFKIFEV